MQQTITRTANWLLTAAVAISMSFITPPATAQDSLRPKEIRALAALAMPIAQTRPSAAIDIDALTLESDFTQFMHPSVPEEQRHRALRRLWQLMPAAEFAEHSAI